MIDNTIGWAHEVPTLFQTVIYVLQWQRKFLTHWDLWWHKASWNLVNIGSNIGLLPIQSQTNTWTKSGLFSIGLGTNLTGILIKILTLLLEKMPFLLFCLGLNVLMQEVLLYVMQNLL